MRKLLFILFLVLLTSACSEPLPEDRQDYVGYWQSEEMVLQILADGNVSYKRVSGNVTTSVNGPLKEFKNDDFVVGVWFMTTRFDVSSPPTKINGDWKMTVDGVTLSKAK